MTALNDAARNAITAGRLAHVVTINFPAFDNPPPGHVIRIKVDRVGGVGPWTES